jgi:hypothetical protein
MPSTPCHSEEGFSPTKNPFRLHELLPDVIVSEGCRTSTRIRSRTSVCFSRRRLIVVFRNIARLRGVSDCMNPWLRLSLWWGSTGSVLMTGAIVWVRVWPETGGIHLAWLTNPFVRIIFQWIEDLIAGRNCWGPSLGVAYLMEVAMVIVTGLEWAATGLVFNFALTRFAKWRRGRITNH